MNKNTNWKQSTPNDQLTALLSAIEGHIITTTIPHKTQQHLEKLIEEIKQLQHFLMNPHEW